MIIEDERDVDVPIMNHMETPILQVESVVDENIKFQEFLERHKQIKDKDDHIALRNALIEYLWDEYKNSVY